ncbi:MAG: hypothetical protein ACR2P2_22770, partial [Nakamurella sp.]
MPPTSDGPVTPALSDGPVTSASDGPATSPIPVVRPASPALARAARRRARFDRLSAGARSALSFWGRSLRLRVLVLTLLFSSVVMIALGLVLQQQIVDRLLDAKTSAAEA